MPGPELCFLPASELLRLLDAREVSALEVMEAHLSLIERIDPKVNAMVTRVPPEDALAAARRCDDARSRREPMGLLAGLPVAHKDLFDTAGLRTTYGSPIYRDFVPETDSPIVARLKSAGAIAVGKTNTPEFGLGSQTFNEVFGATRNPYDLSKTCGGSSGGAAVALATGMVPIADGSDVGGSLRNPAGYCNAVGLRPSPGRVPGAPGSWDRLGVPGALARNAADLALVMQAISGPATTSPISYGESGSVFGRPLERDFRGTRVAVSADLGGLPLDPRTRAVVEAARPVFTAIGCDVEDATPDLTGAHEAFRVQRAVNMVAKYAKLLRDHRPQLKDTAIWNIEEGLALTGEQVGEGERLRQELFARTHAFFERHEFLVCAVSQVPPFPIEQPYVTEIDGVRMETYLDWMKSCYLISATGHPAISVPGGFTPEGLPVGIQIVGRYRDEFGLLQIAHAFEAATGWGSRRPAIVSEL
ncbi:MAG: amidase [Anaerolinea sp.]|nr:amidase [Anaerolinea sp.]